MTTEFRAAIEGNLAAHLHNQRLEVAAGIQKGTRDAGVLIKKRLRMDMRRAGLAGKLENTWRDKFYSNGGPTSLKPAVQVFSKAPHIVKGFTEGTIRSGIRGAYLALPTKFTPLTRKRRGNRPMEPEEFIEAFGEKSLQAIPGPGRRHIYLVSNQFNRSKGKRGGVRKVSSRSKKKGERLLMYTLVRQVRFRRQLNTKQILEHATSVFPHLVSKEVRRNLADVVPTPYALDRVPRYKGIFRRGGVAVGALLNVQMNYNNNPSALEFASDDEFISGYALDDPASFTGSFRVRFNNDTLYNEAEASTPDTFEMEFQLSATRSLLISSPAIRLEKPSADVTGPGGRDITLNFRGEQTGAAPMVTATLKNQIAGY